MAEAHYSFPIVAFCMHDSNRNYDFEFEDFVFVYQDNRYKSSMEKLGSLIESLKESNTGEHEIFQEVTNFVLNPDNFELVNIDTRLSVFTGGDYEEDNTGWMVVHDEESPAPCYDHNKRKCFEW